MFPISSRAKSCGIALTFTAKHDESTKTTLRCRFFLPVPFCGLCRIALGFAGNGGNFFCTPAA